MSEQLITKYRPIKFSEVLGNKLVIEGLEKAVASPSCPHAFLFTGGTGVGKTTLARIIADVLNAFIQEMDAASNSSVEDTRRIVDMTGYRPIMGDKANYMCIIDECHALSKQAWQPLLKLAEDPPPYFYLALCTTEVDKVPATIKSRCYPVALKPIRPFEIQELVAFVAEVEGWQVDPGVMTAIIQASEGSARKALVILQAGHSLKSVDDLASVIADVESDTDPSYKLAKYLVEGKRNWKAISQLMQDVQDYDGAIMVMSRYFSAAMIRSEEQQARDIYRLLRAFTDTSNFDKKIQFNAAIGKILWGEVPF